MGAADARLFVEEGAQVMLTDVLDDDGREVADELGAAAVYRHLDVSSEREWQTVVDDAVATFGGLHVLVNNAGIDRRVSLEDETVEGFEQVLNVNLKGTFLGMRTACRPIQAAGGGSIVNISSMAAIRGYGLGASYASSKWGIRGLTKVAARDLGKMGIRVNSVHPGAVATEMLMANSGSNPQFTHLPVPRCGTVEDVAHLVVFLASDDSAYITGAEHLIDGGYSI
jgi:3alpha(or 20beta)-hydroxysteroid dehydrogenase